MQHVRLLLDRQIAVQGQDLNALLVSFSLRRPEGVCRAEKVPPSTLLRTGSRRERGQGPRQRSFDPRDLALAGQEHQHVARVLRQGVLDRAPGLRFEWLIAARGEMRNRHRVAAASTAEPRRVEELRQPLAVERGRHHHDPQVHAQRRLHIQRQCQAEVGGEVAFVELVEHDRADAFERGIVLDHAGEDALGDHLDPRRCRDLVVEADAVADRLADLLAALPRHEVGGGARGDAARFQHQDLAAGEPRRIEQRRRHLRGLAGTGRRFQHEAWMRGEAGADPRQQLVDGEVLGRGDGTVHRDKDTVHAPASHRPCHSECSEESAVALVRPIKNRFLTAFGTTGGVG